MIKTDNIRNIAIVAHVDHGKTTLVDALLKQTATFDDHQSEMDQELIMDSGDQEKERGITITAKITAVKYQSVHINIIDTPGHADFGGEVERTLHMADGCLLIVDAQEGPMPQTEFVLKKAFQAGLRPIVVINKIDKPAADISATEDKVSDLFLQLATDESQLQYPTLYAIGRDGKAWDKPPIDPAQETDATAVLDAIIDHVPAPSQTDGPLQLLATSLQWDNHEGKYVIGKVERGSINSGDQVALVDQTATHGTFKVTKLYDFLGLGKREIQSASSGQIVAVAGIKDAQISQTLASPDQPEALPSIELQPPTISMYLGPNTSPFKGQEGKFNTSRQIGDRLQRELETNVGLQVEDDGIGFILKGRGELHLSVLIETMRREGYELEVGPPQTVFIEESGQTLEPIELVTVEAPTEHAGAVQSEFGKRRGEMIDQSIQGESTHMKYRIATRALLGLRGILVTATKGTVTMNSIMDGYQPKGSDLDQQRSGALIAWEQGTTTPFALANLEARGTLIVGPGVKVYGGQVIGLSNQRQDLDVNPCKEKHLNNMRSSSSDGAIQLTPATIYSLEESIDFLESDELLEVTPESLRIRKRALDRNQRKK